VQVLQQDAAGRGVFGLGWWAGWGGCRLFFSSLQFNVKLKWGGGGTDVASKNDEMPKRRSILF
jgi:hypothetical protein